jgi:ribosomal protein L16 Arg81 hydroxylase
MTSNLTTGRKLCGLDTLLFPLSSAQFFQTYWEKRVLHICRNDADYFGRAGINPVVEEIIHLHCPQWGDVSLARAGTDPADCPYIDRPPSLRTVERAFADNYTIVINDLQKKDVGVSNVCREIEAALVCRANVNLYLTNKSSQGLEAHYDDDDVFVLQISGEKSWKTYEAKALLPLPNAPYQQVDVSTSEYQTHVIRPGDVLYIPRGVLHEAVAGETPSLHLTVSLNALRWVTLFKALVDIVAEFEPALRVGISPALLSGRRVEYDGTSAEALVKALGDPSYLAKAFGRVQDELLAGMHRLPRHHFGASNDPARVTEHTILKISNDQMCCLDESDGCCVLKAVSTNVRFPLDMRDIVIFMLDTREFSARDLPNRFPIQRRLQIVRELFEDGFLVELT